jgi:biopolymer transport protein ExbD
MRSIQIRKRQLKRKKKGNADIDITPMLDILVILLVFLLRSYNSSEVVLSVPEGIKLPYSDSLNISKAGVMVQVSESQIWVDDKMVIDSKNLTGKNFDHGGRRIINLFNELVRKRKEIENLAKTSSRAKKFSGMVNLIVDKSVKYSYLKKLMYTSAEAGFRTYKFVVLNEE